MRVAHLVSSLNVGGAERFVVDVCRLQREQGIDSCIVSLGSENDVFVELARSFSIPVYTAQGGVLRRQLQLYSTLKNMDVLHFHSPHPLRALRFLVLRFQKKKIIYTRHGAAKLAKPPWPALHKQVKSCIDAVTFVSEEGRNVFMQNHHWLDVENKVIDNGIDLASVKALHRTASSRLSIGSVGRMVTLKNQACLLKAVSQLPVQLQQRIDLHFFGNGECLEQLQKLALGVSCKTTFHGMVDNREQIYNSIDALVVTSETEGLSLAIIEAMAFGRVVVASDVGGNPRLVEHEKNGWLFDYDDSKTLSDYLERLLGQPQLLSQMGQFGKAKIESSFSLSASAELYQELYSA